MTMIVRIQMLLLSVAMAQPQFADNRLPGWWFHVTPVGSPIQPSSATCLLRGGPAVKRDDYTYTPGVGAYKFHTRGLSWPEARRRCEEEGGHLAIINSIAESKAIAAVYQNSGSAEYWAYIGFHDLFQEGEYLTIHGQSIAEAGFSGWRSSDPTRGASENCGSVDKNGELVDISCDGKIPFICELPINGDVFRETYSLGSSLIA